MSEKQYKKLRAEFARKDRMYPDNGRSIRPWERPLRGELQKCLDEGAKRGEKWAIALKEEGERWL